MAGDVYCFMAAVLTLAVVIITVRIAYPRAPKPIFESWQDVIDGWRYLRTTMERLFFIALFFRFVKGPMFLLTLVPFLGAVGAVATAVCGWDEVELRIAHQIIKDLIQAFAAAGAATAEAN